MSKLKGLKTLNIYLIVLSVLLAVALSATVVFAAMTATQKGSNTITIGSLGTVTCSADINGLYPGGKVNSAVTFNVSGQNTDLKGLQLSGFTITGLTLHGVANNYQLSAGNPIYDSITLTMGGKDLKVKDSYYNWTTLSSGAAGTLTILPPFGLTSDAIAGGSQGSPTNAGGYLTDSITSATLTFTLNVSAITN